MLAAAELLVQLFNSFSPQVPPSGDREVPAATAQGRKPTTSRRAAGVRISSSSAVTCSFCALVEAAHYNKKAGLKKKQKNKNHPQALINTARKYSSQAAYDNCSQGNECQAAYTRNNPDVHMRLRHSQAPDIRDRKQPATGFAGYGPSAESSNARRR